MLPIKAYKLSSMKTIALSAKEVMGGMAGSAAASAAAGFAVYGGVMSLGAASTGTAIATLSGAAATNATLAAIGGGSLAAGGLGVAGGTAILSGVVAAPVIAVAGMAYKSKMKDALNNAKKCSEEASEIVGKLRIIHEKHKEIQAYIMRVYREIERLNQIFRPYIDLLAFYANKLETMRENRDNVTDDDINNFVEEIRDKLGNALKLAYILVDIIDTPLFRLKKDAEEPEVDDDGCFIINQDMETVLKNDEA